jgi:hypothetical protein
MRWSVAPYFVVDDVVVTANFYRDNLGFHYERFWGDPPCFCMVSRGGIIIMLSRLAQAGRMRPNRLADPTSEAWDAYVWVDNADELCSEFRAKGAPRTRPDTICAARRRERIGKLHRFGQAPEASLRSGTNAAPVFQRHKRGHDKRCRWHRWQAAQFKGNLGPKSWLR